ncbi:MBL fold metallo-hydrolase [Kineococcus indalonis]|uniref:MBL fold metallo-hydrolase n=1 Tax=Kineococcus indalonis TaxID=2696566 RepID=UPI001411C60C|nr:MBL fold metallo-hydrolase [Kineococcus indalonis]NAZ86393.1 MBL fold metallo-hydrolase [Kineococcus indalonis]
MRITRHGHSCLLVETPRARVLLDPGTFSRGFEELEGLDAVLVTHQHPDHVDVEKLPQLLESDDRTALHAEPQAAAGLRGAGIDAAALHAGSSIVVGDLTVEAVGGEHALIHADVPRVGNVGLLLRAEGEPTLFHPGDTYAVAPPGVDVLALPLSAPWAASKEMIDFVRAVRPGAGFAIHDALLSPIGLGLYASQAANLGGLQLRPLEHGVPADF